MSFPSLSTKNFDAVLFDLDGVLTDSAALHAQCWKQLFDDFLRARDGESFQAFDVDQDYRNFVDGKPRHEGIKSFLTARGIDLPEGRIDDLPTAPTVHGLARRKNDLFLEALEKDGVTTFPAALDFLGRVRRVGMKTALVSSSRNSRAIVEQAGLDGMFDAWVDGNDVVTHVLRGKPDPDLFLRAAAALDTEPRRAVVVEDAISGVEAGVRGGFGLVIGVDRTHHAKALAEAGAHLVVSELNEVPVVGSGRRDVDTLPQGLKALGGTIDCAAGRRLAVCLDYDGTLTPIVDRPALALLSDPMRDTLERLAEVATVAIVSGRDLADLRRLVALDKLYYAGSHGFEIGGPGSQRAVAEHGAEYFPVLDAAEVELKSRLGSIEGVLIERKRLSLAVHYRLVADADRPQVKAITDKVVDTHAGLRRTLGKMVYDLQPDIDWHKGRAVRSLLETLGLGGDDVLTLYIGDDITDEDAFRELQENGLGIVVKGAVQMTWASFVLADTDEVAAFLQALIRHQRNNSN
ncbi:MAG: trehalose-phosphatase [Geminicoccaceae bacterium]